MRFDKLTTKFQQALSDAQSLALGHDNGFIEPAHLLAALLAQEDNGTAALLARAGVNVPRVQSGLRTEINNLPKVSGTGGEITISRDLNNLLNLTDKEATKRGDQFIASELFLLALTDDKGPVGRLLKDNGLTRGSLEAAIDAVRGGDIVADFALQLGALAMRGDWRDVDQRREQALVGAPLADRHEIKRLDHAGLCGEGGFEQIGGRHIAHGRVAGLLRANLEVAAVVGVEQPTERRRAVEVWQAQPVNRAIRRDQRGGAAIADDPVAANFPVARLRFIQPGLHNARYRLCHPFTSRAVHRCLAATATRLRCNALAIPHTRPSHLARQMLIALAEL